MRLAVAVCAGILLAGCGGQPEPVAEEHLRGSGTPLPGGFAVQGGTQLLGPLLPIRYPGHPTGITKWTAILLLDEAPLDTWDTWTAHVAGVLGVDPPPERTGCEFSDDGVSCDVSFPLSGPAGDDPDVHGLDRVDLALGTKPTNVTGRWILELTAPLAAPLADSLTGLGPAVPAFDEVGGTGTPPDHPDHADPREPGGPIDPGTVKPEEEFTLLDGDRVVVNLHEGQATGGVLALVAVDHDLAGRTEEYVDQCRGVFAQDEQPVVTTGRLDGYAVTTYDFDVGAGAGSCSVVGLDGAGDAPDYVLVDRQAD